MNYVFLEVKAFHSKDNKEIYVLSVLDVDNLVVQKIFINKEQFDVLQDFNMFDDISHMLVFRYNREKMCYQLAFAN